MSEWQKVVYNVLLQNTTTKLKMEPHGVFKEVTKQCTTKDHYQSVRALEERD
jgi:hypothetical protein